MPTPSPRPAIEALFAPRSIAVVGASTKPGSIGEMTLANLEKTGFSGAIWAVHPRAGEVFGRPAFPTIAQLPAVPDCVMICLPAAFAVDALAEAAEAGVPSAVIIASGFAETGAAGTALQERIVRIAGAAGMAVCGPNCLGIVSAFTGQASYTAPLPESMRSGGVGLVSQSGTGAILVTNIGRFGFSHVVSTGNEAVTGLADVVGHLAADPSTRVVACFVESVRDPQAFAGAVAEARRAGKHVVVLKVGRTAAGQVVSSAHTASLASSSDVFDRYIHRTGALVARDFDEFVELIELAQSGLRPRRGGLAVVGISGGANVLLCDLADDLGVPFAEFAPATVQALEELAGGSATVMNPFDAGFFLFDEARHIAVLEALAADPGVGILAVSQDLPAALGSGEAAIYRQVTERIAAVARTSEVPVVCFTTVAGELQESVAEPLREAGVPILRGARASLAALAQLLRHAPELRPAPEPAAAWGAQPARVGEAVIASRGWIDRLVSGGAFTENESTRFLAEHGVPVTRQALARDASAAVALAEQIGFPVALKVQSPDIAHKTESGGVRLGLASAVEVEAAFGDIAAAVAARMPDARIDGVLVQEMVAEGVEVLAGVHTSDPLGGALLVGSGGILAELLDRTALDLLPHPDVAGVIDRSGLRPLLEGYRGAAASDTAELERVIALIGAIGTAYAEWIDVIEVNPLTVGAVGQGVRAVDALVIPRTERS
jgi:acyl-CoA synthetase (NDP forming)